MGDRWGLSGRVLAGLGGTAVDEYSLDERYRPTYLQLLVRFRQSDGVTLAIGGGLWGFGERFEGEDGFVWWGPHYLAVEALASRALAGASAPWCRCRSARPYLLAWKF